MQLALFTLRAALTTLPTLAVRLDSVQSWLDNFVEHLMDG